MSALPPALSLTSSFTQVGAIAGFAALVGIALLSLLAFSQAREIKRLREWAGRAPERSSELEQRVSAEAAARIQRAGQPVAPTGVRPVPRKTPLVSAPVSTAVNATVAAGKIGATPTPAPSAPVSSPQAAPVPGAQPGVGERALVESAAVEGAAVESAAVEGAAVEGADMTSANGTPGQPNADTEQASVEQSQQGLEQAAPKPATAAARAVVGAPRPALPPSPSAPAPPGGVAPSAPAVGTSAPPASAGASAAAQSPRPSAPVAAARRTPSRVVAEPGSDGPSARSPAPRAANVASGGAAAGAPPRSPSAPLGASGPKYFKPERSAGRATALIVGGVILAVVIAVIAVTQLKGGKSSPTATASSSSGVTQTAASHAVSHTHAVNPGETAVVVLNGTSTNGLAHHLAADLQQGGYTHAKASTAVPPGTHATTVVEYTSGHRADGLAVAKALDVTRVQPIEASTASLVGSATVVVLAGADQATQLGGGGAHSKGEPSASTGGEAGSAGATGEAGTGAGGAVEGASATGQ